MAEQLPLIALHILQKVLLGRTEQFVPLRIAGWINLLVARNSDGEFISEQRNFATGVGDRYRGFHVRR